MCQTRLEAVERDCSCLRTTFAPSRRQERERRRAERIRVLTEAYRLVFGAVARRGTPKRATPAVKPEVHISLSRLVVTEAVAVERN